MISPARDGSYPYITQEGAQRQWDFALAALPFLWVGAIVCLELLDGNVGTPLPYQLLATSSDILLVLFVTAGLLIAGFAARNGRPLWAAGWSGCTLIALGALPGRMIALQGEEYIVYHSGFLLLAALAVLIGYFLRCRRHPLHALLMVLVFLFCPLFFLEGVPSQVEVVLTIFLALLAATVAALAVLLQRWGVSTLIALFASLLAGIAYALVSRYQEAQASFGGGLLMAGGMFLGGVLISILILFGPWLFWSAADSTRSKLA